MSKDSEYKVKFIPTFSADNLNSLHSWYAKKIPIVMINFLDSFLKKLGSLLMIDFVAVVPDSVWKHELDIRSYHQLSFLKSQGVVTGYFLREKEFDDEPFFPTASVLISGRQRFSYSGMGRSLFFTDVAWGKAIGEAIERWSLDHYYPEKTSIKKIKLFDLEKKLNLDFLTIAGFSTNMREKVHNKRKYKITPNTVFECTEVRELTSGELAQAPLQWFSFKHVREKVDTKVEPALTPLLTTGAATGNTVKEALYRSISEIIERDAFMIHWLRGIAPDRIEITSVGGEIGHRILELSEMYNLETHFLHLKTDFPIHVVMCVLIDRTGIGPAVTVDCASDLQIDQCIEHAFLGASTLRPYVRRNMHKEQSIQNDKVTMATRAFWWSDLKRITDITPFLEGNLTQVAKLPIYDKNENGALEGLLSIFQRYKYPVYARTISPDFIQKEIEKVTVAVKIPHMQPMHLDEEELCDYGARLDEVPNNLGLYTTMKRNKTPHPFV